MPNPIVGILLFGRVTERTSRCNREGMIIIYEVELKARLKVDQIEEITRLLANTFKGSSERCVYHDTYFDNHGQDLMKTERELRLRKITKNSIESFYLTYKESPFDERSRSKLEHEIMVSSFAESAAILMLLGYSEDISFFKHCTNYHIEYRSFEILVTLVRILELQQDFIEVEVQLGEEAKISQVHTILQEFLSLLKVSPDQLTAEYYTDLLRNARKHF